MPGSASSSTSRFPSEELFRTLPERDRLLRGLLGADLIGFHTPAYLRHFAASLTQLGLTVEIDRVQLADREVRLGVFPMGIDAAAFRRPGRGPRGAGGGEGPPRGRERPAPGGRRSAGLHQGHPPPAARPTSGCSQTHPGAARAGAPGPGGRAFPHRGRGLPGFPCAGGRAGRPDQRRLRHAALGAGALHLPRARRAGAGGAVSRGRRHAGDPAARRHEPGGQGVRRLPHRWRRGAGAERVRRAPRGSCPRRSRSTPTTWMGWPRPATARS